MSASEISLSSFSVFQFSFFPFLFFLSFPLWMSGLCVFFLSVSVIVQFIFPCLFSLCLSLCVSLRACFVGLLLRASVLVSGLWLHVN